MQQLYSVDKIMAEARRLAVEYRRATGRPLAIGGEIAKHDAIRLLDLAAAPPDAVGYDAVGQGARAGIRYQIKNRAIFDGKSGQRIGHIKLGADWDRVLLVLLDAEFEPFVIYEATREAISKTYERAAESARARRGPLSVARFKNIAERVWGVEAGDEHLTREQKAESTSDHVPGG